VHPGRHGVKDTFDHAATDATHGGGGEGEWEGLSRSNVRGRNSALQFGVGCTFLSGQDWSLAEPSSLGFRPRE
jgi:hypothetical protein